MRHNLLLNRSRGTASLQPLVLLAIIVVMTGAQAVLVPGSLTVEQMLIISRQASALGIITLGQAAVILVGGIDLSVGATVMMVNIFCISAMQGSDANGPLGLLVCLCDLLARTMFSPYEIPVGIVLSLLGGPFFVYLILRRGKGGLNG